MQRDKKTEYKKNRIGIATFHCAHNYGAFLQAFALQEWIQNNCGSNVEVNMINYRPTYLLRSYKMNLFRRINSNKSLTGKCKQLISFIVELPYYYVKKLKFKKAEERLLLTKPYYFSDFWLDTSYKALILGSDQIWNTGLTNGVDKVYFGMIAGDKCKKISYAASVGISEYPQSLLPDIKHCLSQFDAIGVREKETVEILKSFCNQPIEVNLDPTMIVKPSFWYKYLRKIQYGNYILVYRVSSDSRMMQDAHRIAKESNKIILHFGAPGLKPVFKDVKVKSLSYCGPFDFISYIARADLILTDSFHATCFSVIFNRKFYTYLQRTRSERIRTLASIGGFYQRLLETNQTLINHSMEDIYFSCTDKYYNNFKEDQKKSEHYLLKNLERI